MARSHVPKFGNWDGDNVPYTAYFENARKEKAGGVRINPNDPQQNPEAFNIDNNKVPVPVSVPPPRKRDSRRTRTLSSESTSNDKSSSSSRTSKKKSTTTPPNNNADDFSYRSVSVPKFGEWDENDPKSSQGFTFVFDKVKKEKQIAAATFPSVPQQTTNNYQEKETTKKCCCLF